jgi:hypothetical protein
MTEARKPMKALIAIAVLLLAPSASLDAADLNIVREGKVINLVHPEPGNSYASKNGAVEVRDPRKVFAMDAKLGTEFTVKARISIENALQSAAAVVFDEKDLFLFGGSAGKMLFQSARFKGVKLDRGESKGARLFVLERNGDAALLD